MMDDGHEAPTQLAVLREGPVTVPGAEQVAQRREHLLPGLQLLVTRGALPQPRSRLVPALAAAATLALAAGLALLLQSSGQATAAGPWKVTSGKLASVGADLETGASDHAVLELSGLKLELSASTRVNAQKLPAGTLELRSGRVRCDVAPLGADRRFVVVTPDARVLVHGTVFSVERSRDATTCVRVEEGLVSVERADGSHLLRAGQSAGCAEAVPVAAPPAAVSSAPQVAPKRAAQRGRAQPAPLAEQNKLLERALAAERRGDAAAAAAAVQKLRELYPDSALLPEAERVLQRVRSAAQ